MLSGMLILEDLPNTFPNIDEVEVVLQPFTYKYIEKQKNIGDNFRSVNIRCARHHDDIFKY